MAKMSDIYYQQIGQRSARPATTFWGALSGGIQDFGAAHLSKKAREKEKAKAEADQQSRIELAGMDISNRKGLNAYIDAVRTKLADPEIQADTRKYWESQLTAAQQRVHDFNLADHKQAGAERIQWLKNLKANDGNKTVERMKYDLAMSPQGKTGTKAYFTAGGARILDDVENIKKLAENANKQNIFTNPFDWVGSIFGTYGLSMATNDFHSSAAALGSKMTEDIRQLQEQLGLSQKGPFTDADAQRLASVISALSPKDANGNPQEPISYDEFLRRVNAIEDRWVTGLGNQLLQWKEDENGRSRLWAFGQNNREDQEGNIDKRFDLTDIKDDPRAIYIRLNQLAQDSTYEGNFSPLEAKYIIEAINSKIKGGQRTEDIYDAEVYGLSGTGWRIK